MATTATTTTTDAKAEAKAPAEPKEVEETSVPSLKYKTCVLKVSIHCVGCRDKVKKILKGMDGVYELEVDMRLNKVTVKGKVEADALIKKLNKEGKHAELWPDQKANNNNNSNDKKKNKGKNKEKQHGDCEGAGESSHGGGSGGDTEQETVRVEVGQVGQESAKKNNGEGGSTSKKGDGANMGKPSEGGGAPVKIGGGCGGGQVKETKPEVLKQNVNFPNQPPVYEKCGGAESYCVGEHSGGGGGGSGGKKKKNKGQIGNPNADEDEEQCDDAPPNNASPNHGNVHHVPHGPRAPQGFLGPHGVQGPYGPHGVQVPPNHSLPRQHVYDYQYPRQYYNPPVQAAAHYNPPVQAAHYNAAYSTSSYGASHYAAPPAYTESYTYVPSSVETETEPPSYHMDSYPPQQYYQSQPPYYAPQPSNSFELFSDENANGCHIM